MDDQVDDETKKKWEAEIYEIQSAISAEKAAAFVGRTLDCFIEGRIETGEAYVARSYADGPSDDCYVFIETDDELISGEYHKVLITGSNGFNLLGRLK